MGISILVHWHLDFEIAQLLMMKVTSLMRCSCNLHTLRSRQNGRHFPDDIFKWILLNENVWISIKISLKFVPMGPMNNITALVQIMVWCRLGDKPLSEPMMFNLLTHICVTQPQWNPNTGKIVSLYWNNGYNDCLSSYRDSHFTDKMVP